MKLNARAVTQAIGFVIARDRFDYWAKVNCGHALQSLFENIGFELALACQFDVTKFGAARTPYASLLPDLLYAIG